jgi:hypothetical protein
MNGGCRSTVKEVSVKRTLPVHALLLCAFAALCLAPIVSVPAIQEQPAATPELPPAPDWLPATGSFCEGNCDGAEIHFPCAGTSAQGCCTALKNSGRCTSFSGGCEGDADISCSF